MSNAATRESVDGLLQRIAEVTDTEAFTKAQVITLAALLQAALDDTLGEHQAAARQVREGLDSVRRRLERLLRRVNLLEWLLLLAVIGNAACWYWLTSR